MREDDMGRTERTGAGVGVLDQLTLVSGIHHKNTGFNVQFVKSLLQMTYRFSCKNHSGNVEIDVRILGDFAEF